MADKYFLEHPENNVDIFVRSVAGPYDIPVIRPEKYEDTRFVSFACAKGVKERQNVGVHFFLYDYLFSRLWISKYKYLPLLSGFKAVMSPDFSLYTDWPVMVQMWNHYRKHVLAAWMQDNGIKVYPTISWSDEKSYAWCFDGEPVGATVCVSSVGTQKSRESRRLFRLGYDRMMEVLRPETIVFYGAVPEGCEGNIVPLEPYYMKLRGIQKND